MTSISRKLFKSITWRLTALFVLTAVGYLFLGSATVAGQVAIVYTIIQVLLFYFHEEVWEKIRWGTMGGVAVQFTGLSGAGKSTIALAVQEELSRRGFEVEVIDGDEYRTNLCCDLGFSKEDRIENIRRLSFVAHKLAGQGKVSIIAAINPFEESREFLKNHASDHLSVHIDVPIEVAIERDVKGLYAKALLPADDPNHIPNFTGISDPFEVPKNVDLTVDTSKLNLGECVGRVVQCIVKQAKRRKS